MPENTKDDGTLVRLPGGWVVPERFSVQLRPRRRSDSYEIGVVMVGGRPLLSSLRIVVEGEPIPPERLPKLDLVEMLDAAVREMAIQTTPRRRYSFDEVEDMGAEAFHDVIRSTSAGAMGAARAARRRRITPELLEQVVELYESPEGYKAIMEDFKCSERTARRWLARAREAGLR